MVHTNLHWPSPWQACWISYGLKLWPAIRYGLGTLARPAKVLDKILSPLEFKLLPIMGVNRHIKTGWRTLPRAFGGAGMLSLMVEHTISAINLLVQHFGTPSIVGKKMSASLEALQLEIGCPGNPLELDYSVYGVLATRCWLQSLWEKLHRFGFRPKLDVIELPPPKVGDASLTSFFVERGARNDTLKSLDRCRLYLELLFMSDIAMADRRQLDDRLLHASGKELASSKYSFPRECPTKQDWVTWSRFWVQNTQPGRVLH